MRASPRSLVPTQSSPERSTTRFVISAPGSAPGTLRSGRSQISSPRSGSSATSPSCGTASQSRPRGSSAIAVTACVPPAGQMRRAGVAFDQIKTVVRACVDAMRVVDDERGDVVEQIGGDALERIALRGQPEQAERARDPERAVLAAMELADARRCDRRCAAARARIRAEGRSRWRARGPRRCRPRRRDRDRPRSHARSRCRAASPRRRRRDRSSRSTHRAAADPRRRCPIQIVPSVSSASADTGASRNAAASSSVSNARNV